MEEEQKDNPLRQQTVEPQVEGPAEKKSSFLSRRRKKLKINKKSLITIVGVLIIGGLAGWLIFRGGESEEVREPSPTPGLEEITSTPTPISALIEKDKIRIEVLNGTGIAQEAAYLQGKLADLGYSDIETGDADSEDYVETEVTFSSGLAQEVIDEITQQLESIYKQVDTKTSSSLDVDVQVITGYRKGHTPTPTQTPTPTPAEEATPTSTPSATPTP